MSRLFKRFCWVGFQTAAAIALAHLLAVNLAPAYPNSSSALGTKFTLASLPLLEKVMNPLNASTFPNHKYDFGDRVRILSLAVQGTVEGIRYNRADNSWHYSLSCCCGAAQQASGWWPEDDLEPDD